MQKFEPLLPGSTYHVYNKGINGENLFQDSLNYQHFLILYQKYIDPIADTFAWCLMPNHFHFLVRIWDPDRVPYPFQKITDPSRAFSHLFNAYAQAYNKRNERSGGLFKTPFQRKQVDSADYFRRMVYYIHNNPVKHGFTEFPEDYPWSSYRTLLSLREASFSDSKVVGWFDSKAEFVEFHGQEHHLLGNEKVSWE